MAAEVACIVEGHGETEALPVLLRRLAASAPKPRYDLRVYPIRVHASRFLHWKDESARQREITRTVELAARKTGRKGGILVLLDLEDGCPAMVAPSLLKELEAAAGEVPLRLVLAHREFETWFVAAVESLGGVRGLASDVRSPENPESIRDAKGWLARWMEKKSYEESTDQAAMASAFSLERAEQVNSFRKLKRDFLRLLEDISPP